MKLTISLILFVVLLSVIPSFCGLTEHKRGRNYHHNNNKPSSGSDTSNNRPLCFTYLSCYRNVTKCYNGTDTRCVGRRKLQCATWNMCYNRPSSDACKALNEDDSESDSNSNSYYGSNSYSHSHNNNGNNRENEREKYQLTKSEFIDEGNLACTKYTYCYNKNYFCAGKDSDNKTEVFTSCVDYSICRKSDDGVIEEPDDGEGGGFNPQSPIFQPTSDCQVFSTCYNNSVQCFNTSNSICFQDELTGSYCLNYTVCPLRQSNLTSVEQCPDLNNTLSYSQNLTVVFSNSSTEDLAYCLNYTRCFLFSNPCLNASDEEISPYCVEYSICYDNESLVVDNTTENEVINQNPCATNILCYQNALNCSSEDPNISCYLNEEGQNCVNYTLCARDLIQDSSDLGNCSSNDSLNYFINSSLIYSNTSEPSYCITHQICYNFLDLCTNELVSQNCLNYQICYNSSSLIPLVPFSCSNYSICHENSVQCSSVNNSECSQNSENKYCINYSLCLTNSSSCFTQSSFFETTTTESLVNVTVTEIEGSNVTIYCKSFDICHKIVESCNIYNLTEYCISYVMCFENSSTPILSVNATSSLPDDLSPFVCSNISECYNNSVTCSSHNNNSVCTLQEGSGSYCVDYNLCLSRDALCWDSTTEPIFDVKQESFFLNSSDSQHCFSYNLCHEVLISECNVFISSEGNAPHCLSYDICFNGPFEATTQGGGVIGGGSDLNITTLSEFISSESSFSNLVSFVNITEGAEVIPILLMSNESSFLVFAPTNEAFSEIESLNSTGIFPDKNSTIFYHICPDFPSLETQTEVLLSTFSGDSKIRFLNCTNIKNLFTEISFAEVSVVNGVPLLNESLQLANGKLFAINKILFPPKSFLQTFEILGNFSVLISLWEKSSDTVKEILAQESTTFFAPNDDAFLRWNETLFESFGVSVEELNQTMVDLLLLNHVVDFNFSLYSSCLVTPFSWFSKLDRYLDENETLFESLNPEIVSSFVNGNFTVESLEEITYNEIDANLLRKDITVLNGVFHEISEVFVPSSFFDSISPEEPILPEAVRNLKK